MTFSVATFNPERIAINVKKIPSFLQYLSKKFNYPLKSSTRKWRWKRFWCGSMRLVVEQAWESEDGLIVLARREEIEERYLVFVLGHRLNFNEDEQVHSYFLELYLPVRPCELLHSFLTLRYCRYSPYIVMSVSLDEGKVSLWSTVLDNKKYPPPVLMRNNKFIWSALKEIDDYISLVEAMALYNKVGGAVR